eukprot:scaffold111702_cov63-Phaeocystis_antarctica.AAC.1
MARPGARVSTVMGRRDFEWALQPAGSAEKAVALDTRPRATRVLFVQYHAQLSCNHCNSQLPQLLCGRRDVGSPELRGVAALRSVAALVAVFTRNGAEVLRALAHRVNFV